MKLSKLTQKVVINTLNGEMLGYISDMEIDMHTYEVVNIIVEEKPSLISRVLPWIFKEKSMSVPIKHITSIGSDVILVECNKIK